VKRGREKGRKCERKRKLEEGKEEVYFKKVK
jgi:hypothetical protein